MKVKFGVQFKTGDKVDVMQKLNTIETVAYTTEVQYVNQAITRTACGGRWRRLDGVRWGTKGRESVTLRIVPHTEITAAMEGSLHEP